MTTGEYALAAALGNDASGPVWEVIPQDIYGGIPFLLGTLLYDGVLGPGFTDVTLECKIGGRWRASQLVLDSSFKDSPITLVSSQSVTGGDVFATHVARFWRVKVNGGDGTTAIDVWLNTLLRLKEVT